MPPLKRGANVALTREIPTLSSVVIGVRWDAGGEVALERNLVLAALLCGPDDRVVDEHHFVFFNQLTSPDLSVSQLTQALAGDDEQITIDLHDVPATIDQIVVALYVNDGPGPRRTLAQLRSCHVRVLNRANETELIKSEDLATVLTSERALALGEMYRHGGDWKFKVLGQGYDGGVTALAADYGLSV